MASSTNRTSRADRGTPGGTHDAKAAAGRKTARPSPMFDDAIRLIRILQLIPQNRPIDTQEIQEELRREGIDLPIRTLQRYLQTIRSDAADFAIDCDETVRPRRYRWSPNAKGIQLPRLSPVEAVLLRFAEEGLRHHLPTGALNGLRPMLRTAKRNLAPDAARANTSWLEKIVVTPPTLPVTVPAIRASVFEAAIEALFSEMVMHGRYRRDTGRFSEIDLHPLGLIQHQSRTFVVGYEEPRGVKHTLARIRRRRLEEAGQPVEEERPVIGLYALHRFDDARVTLLPALIPEDFSLEDFVRRANFEGKRGRTVRLTVVTDSPDLVREILESPLCATQEASVDPDSTDEAPLWRVVAVLEDSALLDAWLAQRAEWIIRSTKEQLRAPEPLVTPGSF